MSLQGWMLESLGARVVLTRRVGGHPPGRTGTLVSLQAGKEPGSSGPYATVCFDLLDWSKEESVPLFALRPMSGAK
jgi:hypothetical protein